MCAKLYGREVSLARERQGFLKVTHKRWLASF